MRPIPCREDGFTLIELMIGLGLTAVLVLGVLGVFTPLTQTYRLVNELSQVQENGRFGMLIMSRDFRMAGYFGHIINVEDLDPDPPSGAANDCGQDWIQSLAQPLLGFDHSVYDADSPFLTCITDNNVASDMMVLRMSETSTTAVGDLVDGQDYLFSNFSTGEVIRAPTAPLVPTLPDGEYRALKAVVFYIRKTTSGVYSLVRYDTTVGASAEVVEGVEDMQLRFGLQSAAGRFVEDYVDATAVTDWGDVMTVKVELLARTTSKSWKYTANGACRDNARTYVMGNRTHTPSDSLNACYRRRVYTSIFQLRNN